MLRPPCKHYKNPTRIDARVTGQALFYVVSILLLLCSEVTTADESTTHWWTGFSFTPGVGFRHLGIDVTRKTDGFNGNIAQGPAAKLFYAFSISSPEYQFGASNWGISIRNYNSFVSLDRQFYDYKIKNETTGTNTGERINVGTKISGRYSYLVPAIHYKIGRPDLGSFKFATGFGLWNADFSGNIALTENNQPNSSTVKTDISLKTNDQLAYLVFMAYTSPSRWTFEMTVGGPEFEDNTFKYQVEEVSMIFGKTFEL